jgi:hypothetical protein
VKISGGSRAAIRLWDTSASGAVALRCAPYSPYSPLVVVVTLTVACSIIH